MGDSDTKKTTGQKARRKLRRSKEYIGAFTRGWIAGYKRGHAAGVHGTSQPQQQQQPTRSN